MKKCGRTEADWGRAVLLIALLLLAGIAGAAETNEVAVVPESGTPPLPQAAVPRLETNAAAGAVTSSIPVRAALPAADEQALRSYLEVQAKLHSTLLAIEQARQEAGASSASNAALLAERLHQLESALASQRLRERDATDQSNRTLLIAAGGFAGLGVLALGLVIFYQMRGMTRLAEIATAIPMSRGFAAGLSLPAPGAGEASLALLAGSHAGGAETDATRLLGVIDRLERRIQELEQTAHAGPPLSDHATKADKVAPSSAAKGGPIGSLLDRAKALEKQQRHAEALACCDEALAAEPTLTRAWLLKASQLQALGREKEALRCYEAALQGLEAGGPAAV
jgi:tetratricopeptide (TPR) repeat protein